MENPYERRELPDHRKQIKRKFLVFRPYEDPMAIRPYQAPDRGYYFYLHKNDIKIVRFTLEDNGFRDVKSTIQNYKKNEGQWTVYWAVAPIKK